MITVLQQGAILPESIKAEVARGDDFIAKWSNARSLEFVELTLRELSLVVEYTDIISDEIRVLVGLPGAEYSVVWSNYASMLPRVTIDDIENEKKKAHDASAVAGQRITTTTLERRAALRARPVDDSPDDGDIGEIE